MSDNAGSARSRQLFMTQHFFVPHHHHGEDRRKHLFYGAAASYTWSCFGHKQRRFSIMILFIKRFQCSGRAVSGKCPWIGSLKRTRPIKILITFRLPSLPPLPTPKRHIAIRTLSSFRSSSTATTLSEISKLWQLPRVKCSWTENARRDKTSAQPT